MEGLIPFVYRAFVQYKNGKEGPLGSFFSESPSYSYMRLPSGGDSGRFQTSASALLSDNYGFTSSSSATQVLASSGVVQSPHRRLTPRRVSATKSA
ncbi:hypothetical protein QN277_025334 [Acacia crassicarpa]|uniref:Uncharacterized protein n=1 Tax=Acacia crassicarpa TaxID=499986 RepID=A0AAE1JDZ7_9FABA|nr:hypothetical protein QN277_025334 [Acacia crassicarpa]